MAAYKKVEADVAVVGGGIAGCLAAIRARELADNVLLLDKGKVGRSGCSPFAAGIFLVFLPQDNFDVWMKEMVETGFFLSDQEWVNLYLREIHPVAEAMDAWAREQGSYIFERDSEGSLIRRQSRGHKETAHCVVNSLPMMDALRRRAVKAGVKIMDRTAVAEVMVRDGRAGGVVGFNYRTGELLAIKAKATVLAGGGCAFGSVFMGVKNLTGDIQAAAYRAGAVLQNMEFANSNTTARDYDIHGLNLFVSAGGRFLNARGQEFMKDYHPALGSRAPQCYLVEAFCQEVKEGRGPIYLDLSAASPEDQRLLRKILPETFKVFDRAGLTVFQEPIPWIPAFQGTICVGGGITINTRAETNLAGLYAAGDATSMPANGSTNIGGLCLSFAGLTGHRAGRYAAEYAKACRDYPLTDGEMRPAVQATINDLLSSLSRSDGTDPDELEYAIQKVIIPLDRNYIKSKERLSTGLAELEGIKKEATALKARDLHELVKVVGVRSELLLAELFLRASLLREESRGLHFREDFPLTNNRDWLKWIMVQKDGEKPKLWTEPIPLPYLKPSEDFSLPPGVKGS